jgi:glycogen debranching enzyme
MADNVCLATQESAAFASAPEHQAQARLAIKHLNQFLVTDTSGWLPGGSDSSFGAFYNDTRYLTRWLYRINGRPLRLLKSSVSDGYAGQFIYGNPNLGNIREQTVRIKREVVIVNERFRERATITNFGPDPVSFDIDILFDADFADMFEVRGMPRPARGELQSPVVSPDGSSVVLSYRGLDGLLMTTVIAFHGAKPTVLHGCGARFALQLDPATERTAVLEMSITTMLEGEELARGQFKPWDDEYAEADRQYQQWRAAATSIVTGNPEFNRFLERCYRDLYILRMRTARGACIGAGIPWYSVAYGRDQCITGLETVPFMQDLARDIVLVLAAYQGTVDDEFTQQMPGKIMHELRPGETGRLKEHPFYQYYGTVDATELWLMLLGQYICWTGDTRFARKLWRNIRRALDYLDRAVKEGNGYLVYGNRRSSGLSNQGWKDSDNSVMHGDGVLAKPPVAICEAQGYLYAAWLAMADLAERLGYKRQARLLRGKADALKERFNRDFWMPDRNFVALAVDGDGRQCDVVSSNPGHLLATGILSDKHAAAVARRLCEPDMLCVWGLRTLSSAERAYNPMSYHNGSIWPHDNVMAAEGLWQRGERDSALHILQSLFEVALHQPNMRLPELFCGFGEEDGAGEAAGPTSWPVTCEPQAWAAGAVFMLLKECLGLRASAGDGVLRIVNPQLPEWLGDVEVRNLRAGSSSFDLRYSTADGITTCRVLAANGTARLSLQTPAT